MTRPNAASVLLLCASASAQVRIQYPFGAGPVVVQCPSGDITVTCGEAAATASASAPAAVAPVADDVSALRRQMAEMEARLARMTEERQQLPAAGAESRSTVAARVSASGEVAPTLEPAATAAAATAAAAASGGPPPTAAEIALLSRLEISHDQLYAESELDLSSRRLDDADCATLAVLLTARGVDGMGRLRKLWLSENLIGDAGATSLLAALQARE